MDEIRQEIKGLLKLFPINVTLSDKLNMLLNPDQYKINELDIIVLKVCALLNSQGYKVNVNKIRGKTNKPDYVRARAYFSLIVYNIENDLGDNKYSLTDIKNFLGYKDHTSIMHLIDTIRGTKTKKEQFIKFLEIYNNSN